MENSVKNIIIVGTGGQGVILASEILSDVALDAGFDVKKSEIHGMAQRGGVVTSHVRYGEKVSSPLISKGTADILLSFELAEAARWIPYLKEGGKVVTSTQKIVPPIVSSGLAKYPDNAADVLKQYSDNPIIVDALSLASELGNSRLVNTILLGIIFNLLNLPEESWKKIVSQRVPAKFKDLNMKAFDKGKELSA